jgi:DnaJ-class molecular chaperone
MFSSHEVRIPTDRKCKRCAGKGIGTWGMTYGECFRCGGAGVEFATDVAATMKQFEETLARIKSEGEAAKVAQSVAANVLSTGNARRSLEFARRMYKEVLIERQRCATHFKVTI